MRCDVEGIDIHYDVKGRGRPFLMLHGTPLDHTASEAELEPALRGRPGWKRIYPDMPGHGKTPGAPSIRDMDDYLRVMLKFVDQVLPRRRFVLGGTSFGAYVALGIAHERPERIDGLLLAVPAVSLSPRRRRPLQKPIRLLRNDRVRSQARREGINWYLHLAVAETPESLAFTRILSKTRADTKWLATIPDRDYAFDLDSWKRPFPAPCLFLLGRQDHPFRYRQLWALLDHFPRATFAVLDRAGHILWGEQSGLARALVQEWVDRVEGWSPGV
jgi:pimeloyl-ACP methyl ester carboxylesterase